MDSRIGSRSPSQTASHSSKRQRVASPVQSRPYEDGFNKYRQSLEEPIDEKVDPKALEKFMNILSEDLKTNSREVPARESFYGQSSSYSASEDNMDLASQVFKIYKEFSQETSSPILPSEENTQSLGLTPKFNHTTVPTKIRNKILEIFKDMEKDYENKPLFANPGAWCGLTKPKIDITRAKYVHHALNFEKTLALTVKYYRKLMESIEKAGSTSSAPLEIQEKDISHILISDANMKKAMALTHIELIKGHEAFFLNKHDKILEHILKHKDIYTIGILEEINKYYINATAWCRDSNLQEQTLKRTKGTAKIGAKASRLSDLLSMDKFLKLMIPICRIFIPNAKHETLSNEDFFKELCSNKLEYLETLKKVILLTQAILHDFHDINTNYLDNDIKNYLEQK